MLARLRTLAAAREDFAFETTLASRSFAPWLRGLRGQGFRVHVAFLSLPSSELAIARVAARVRRGGHAVPEDVVRRRFTAGLTNFFSLFEPVADSWQMFDSSEIGGPRLIAARSLGVPAAIEDPAAWRRLVEAGR